MKPPPRTDRLPAVLRPLRREHVEFQHLLAAGGERQAIHDLSCAIADVGRAYDVAQVAYNRLGASQDQYRRAYDAFFELQIRRSRDLLVHGLADEAA